MNQPIKLYLDTPDGVNEVLVSHERRALPLTEILRREGWPLNTRCGGRGLCRGCTVELVDEGRVEEIRACECFLPNHDHRIRIPARAILAYEPQVVTNFKINVPRARAPLTTDSQKPLGIAVDIGTTTVAVLLVELDSGQVLSQSGAFNRQMHLGDDVLTRINLCLADPLMIGQMQGAVVNETLLPLVKDVLDSSGRGSHEIGCMAIAANTTMLHLFAGEDPSSMGVAPFTPRFVESKLLCASEIGLEMEDALECPIFLLPGAAAYVGADLCSGIIASGLAYEAGPSLLVDVGTNGEIILKKGDQLFGCATAAGPAFEGAGLTCGMRAGNGAIAHIGFGAEPFATNCVVIEEESTPPVENDKPRRQRADGICGSAYIDFLARGRECGILSPTGRLENELPSGATDYLLRNEAGRAWCVAKGQGNRRISISEQDVARLLQAKAAIAAGILTLLDRVGVSPAEVKTLHLAGGFGMHIDLQSAIGSGLLPGFEPEQVSVVGNTSLAGAYLALTDRSTLEEMERIARRIEIVELNQDPEFEARYIENLLLP
jgi:uncharacterized 2Fe-2S/4Fe-4S cluster protein (DUF4445 family)